MEDTRFNGPAKDGAEYTEEGIYTITVSNDYTNQFTVKKIYVGTNRILRAYMTTGLSIPEINNLVAEGAIILDDGTIKLAEKTTASEETVEEEQTTESLSETTVFEEAVDAMVDIDPKEAKKSVSPIILLIAFGAVVAVGAAVSVIIRKKKAENADKDKEGESE